MEGGAPSPPAADPRGATLHQLVEAQAAARPTALALVDGALRLTFGDLDRRADLVANELRARGVGPDVLVGLHLRRSPEAVVAILAILKAGGAYLPLDPGYPGERLTFMVDDAGPALVVVGPGQPTPPWDRPVVELDAVAATPAGAAPVRVASGAGPDNLACVIYTSGSTGRPKGVLGTHGSFVSRLAWIRGVLPFGAGEMACLRTPLSFVDSVGELFRPLSEGVPSALVADDVVGDPRRLARRLEDAGVTRIVLVPSLLRALHDEVDLAARLPRLRTWIVSGEVLPSTLARHFLEARPHSRLFNFYGSSEVAADATWHEVRPGDPDPIPIGMPVQGVVVHIIGGDGAPVPPGEEGELYVAGTGLARGYLRRPDLTADRFLPDPYGAGPEARMFRTGDRGRLLPGGQLEYRGRSDHQVKVDGVRVECGEIEARLLAHAGVRQAVVRLSTDRAGYARLVALVVPQPAVVPDPAELRRHLEAFLPRAMVPTIELVEELPLTPSGKVDRLRIPAPGTARPAPAWPAPEPPDGVVGVVADVWSQVLDTRPIGADDDFAALGGRSLHAARVAGLLGERLGIDLPVRAVFEAPTPATLAAALAGRPAAAGAGLARTPATRGPLSTFQSQLWVLEQWGQPGRLNETRQIVLPPGIGVEHVRCAIELLVDRHAVLRTSFPVVEGRPEQVLGAAPAVHVEVAELGPVPARIRAESIGALAVQENAEPFDIARGPLFRARLVSLGEHGSVLLLTVDHLVGDGESMAMLDAEVAHCCASVAAGREVRLPALPLRCLDHAVWQRAWFTPERERAELDWWARRLACLPIEVALPYDRPLASPEDQYRSGPEVHSYEVPVPVEVRRRLGALITASRATMLSLCVAAVDALVAPYQEGERVVVTTTVSGRDRPELERLLGYFAVPATLLADVAGDPPFAGLLARVHDSVVGLFEHKDVSALAIAGVLRDAGLEIDRAVHPVDVQYFPTVTRGWEPGAAAVGVPPLEASHRREDVAEAIKPLSFAFHDDGRHLWFRLRYRPELFDRATVEGLAAQLSAILARVSQRPDLRLSELPTLEPALSAGSARPGAPR